MNVQRHVCETLYSSRTSFSLLVSEEKFDDGVGFEIHLVHVGVLVLHHLNTERQTDIVRTQSTSDRNIKTSLTRV